MRRLLRGFTLLFGIAAVVLVAGPASAAAPAPSYAITLTDDGSCHFTAKASWSHAKVSEVDVTWSFGIIASWQDALTPRGHNAVDTFTGGSSGTQRTWSVSASFYSGTTLLATASDDDMVACALQL